MNQAITTRMNTVNASLINIDTTLDQMNKTIATLDKLVDKLKVQKEKKDKQPQAPPQAQSSV